MAEASFAPALCQGAVVLLMPRQTKYRKLRVSSSDRRPAEARRERHGGLGVTLRH